MLKKRERLTRKEFDRFFSSGKRFHSSSLQLVYTPHEQFHGAVAVGKKVSKKAVARNKLRRRLYHILYAAQKAGGQKGVFICTTKPSAAGMSFQALGNELRELIGRARTDHKLNR